ncbi:MAG TPA: hypothetical protein PLX84_01430, partial [Acidiphilium sp.]|nr:hypothetical protein [Acidiphilium sp.]
SQWKNPAFPGHFSVEINNPVGRWTQHLGPEGSLRTALKAQDDVDFDLSSPISFFAVEIGSLPALFPEVQVKSATQAVEHEIHMLLRAQPTYLGAAMKVISDTEKTAPRAFRRWDIAAQLAEEAAAKLRAAIASSAF